MRLTKEQLTRKGLRRKDITIPDVDGVVSVRELTAAEVRDYAVRCRELEQAEGDGFDLNAELLARIVVLGVVDEHGKQMFAPEDIESVKSMSLATLNHLAKQISEFSGVNAPADQKKDATA